MSRHDLLPAVSCLLVAITTVMAAQQVRPDENVRVLLDTDANNEVDDQHAIAYMLFSGHRFDVQGITVNRTAGGGSIDEQYAEAVRVLTGGTAGRSGPSATTGSISSSTSI